MNSDEELALETVVHTIKQKYNLWEQMIVVFAVANNMNATPGLEFIYDMYFELKIKSKSEIIVMADHSDVFLGYDKALEPDAISGVAQVQISSIDAPIQTISRLYNIDLKTPLNRLSKAPKGSLSMAHMALLVAIGIICSYYFKLFKF
jgi:hypothetical protein